MISPKHCSIVVDLRPHFLCVYITLLCSSLQQTKGGMETKRVYGKRNNELSVQSFNTHRVEHTGYPAVSGTSTNYCQTFKWQNFKFLKLLHDTKPTKRTNSFLDSYITLSHWIFLHVSIHKGHSSGDQTKVMQHKAKLATFVYSWRGVRESNGINVSIS